MLLYNPGFVEEAKGEGQQLVRQCLSLVLVSELFLALL